MLIICLDNVKEIPVLLQRATECVCTAMSSNDNWVLNFQGK